MKRRNVEHIRVGDGVLWCGLWLVVRRFYRFESRTGREWVDLTMESDERPAVVYHYEVGEQVISSRRKDRRLVLGDAQ